MDSGFETIGNATVIVHDRGPLLATDPWIMGGAYFGSWALSHEVPDEQMNAVKSCRYIWLSHGHPDHLSGDSIAMLKDKIILLPDHFGGRIEADLTAQGYDVRVLKDRVWNVLTPRVRVMSIADYNQDAILLIDVNGTLIVNLNDASDRGWAGDVKEVVRHYDRTFLLALTGYGDAGMINMWDEQGRRVLPEAAKKNPVGLKIVPVCEFYGVKYFVPFSSMHRYQRADSAWANEYATKLHDYANGFESKITELLPAFIQYDCVRHRLTEIQPKASPDTILPPSEFGDNWDERLERQEAKAVEAYFKSIQTLESRIGFVNLRVGGQDNIVEVDRRNFKKGITFEAPRHSLMTAIQFEVFDDLLIGNFTRTTLHGDWRRSNLDRDFTPYVAKYADNGRIKTPGDLERYFASYRSRDPLGFFRAQVDRGYVRPFQSMTSDFLRHRLGERSPLFNLIKKSYWTARKLAG